MAETIVALLSIGAMFALALFICALSDMRRNKMYRESVLAGFDEQQPETFEALPAILLKMHTNTSALKQEVDFEILPPTGDPLPIEYFMPLRQDSLGFVRETCSGSWFPVAENLSGQYCIELDPLMVDPPVHFFYFDYGENRVVAPALSDFLSWPRRYRKGRWA